MRLLVALALATACAAAQPPQGTPGAAADELAQRIVAAVGGEAWAKTGAIEFVYLGRITHLWDKARGFDRVTRGDDVVLVDQSTRRGVAYRKGVRLEGDDAAKAIDLAWKLSLNDTYWLNPTVKVFDQGVQRSIVDVDGTPSLLAQFTSGGATPGDAYLFIPGDDGAPRAWRLWTNSPVPRGTQFEMRGWVTLPTGARVATKQHSFGIDAVTMEIRAAGATLADIAPGPDPFAALVAP